MKTEKIKLYENRDDVTLTTYVLDDSPEMLNGKNRPAVLICPGGAYMSCSDREGEPVALRFASMGYHAFVLRYSTYGEGQPMFFPEPGKKLEPKAHCKYPNPMREIGMALTIISEKSDEWLVEKEKIAICGFSAGAHNCAMYGAYWNTPIIENGVKPAAVILGYPLSDYVFMSETVMEDPMAAGLFMASNTAFFGKSEWTREDLELASPARNITSDMPPTYIWTTSEDSLVPVQHSIRLAHALADKKIPFELHIFENGPHGLGLADQSTAAAISSIYPEVSEWVPMAETWLNKRFSLDLPAKTVWEIMEEQGKL